jgi:hypothetical protein
VVLSDVLVTVNTRTTLVVVTGGAIVPFVPITPMSLEALIAMVYPFGTVGNAKLVASAAGTVTLLIPVATPPAVGAARAMIKTELPPAGCSTVCE